MSNGESPTVFGEGLVLRGRVHGSGDVELRGRLEGDIEIDGTLVVAEGAAVRGFLHARRVVIRGALLGDVSAVESLLLEASARVVGNLYSPRVGVALGAQVRGLCDMSGDPQETAASRAAKASPADAATSGGTREASNAVAREGSSSTREASVREALPREAAVRPAPAPAVRMAAAPRPMTAPSPMAAPSAPEELEDGAARKAGPPEPLVPAIKKGARAVPKRKNEAR